MLQRCYAGGVPTWEPLDNLANMNDALVPPRKYHRYRLEVPVIFSWKDAQRIRQQQVGFTRDLSVGGAFVVATNPPPLNANVKLKEALPPRGQILRVRMFGEGQIVRVEPASGSRPAGFAVGGGRIAFRRWAENV
jgi:hypothetical protein